MSVEALMTETVTLRTPSGETVSAIGEVTRTFTDTETTMYLEPTRGGTGFTAGQEVQDQRNTPIGDWLGIGRADVAFTAWCQIVYGTHTFDIIAPPRPMPNPRTGEISHIELSLQEVT